MWRVPPLRSAYSCTAVKLYDRTMVHVYRCIGIHDASDEGISYVLRATIQIDRTLHVRP